MKKVFTNGCFDVLHRGHFELLKYCKSLGHVIVGLNSDSSIKKLKGDARPIFSQEDRIFMLKSCKFVDEVYIFDEDTPYNLIKDKKPDIIVKGGDYTTDTVVGNDLCEVKIFKYIDGYSTTNTLNKI
jgi:rfaE bifunctional protein nucleotidyltransferase chain/domain|tara:strand:- start:1489 stop:1869 length:381 start_codon:yes stop_codon:yes gene_type:complete